MAICPTEHTDHSTKLLHQTHDFHSFFYIGETLILQAGRYNSESGDAQGDVFYFDYRVVAFWGLEKPQVSSSVQMCDLVPRSSGQTGKLPPENHAKLDWDNKLNQASHLLA